MAVTINASTSAGLVQTADLSGNLSLQSNGTTVLTASSSTVTAPSITTNGVSFPATQVPSADANTLDDYEEGTWTPNQGGGLVVTGAFSSTGNYTKIGRMVYVSGKVAGATSLTFGTTAVICTNLPFTAITDPQQPGSGVMGNTASGPPTLAYNTTVFALSAGSGGSTFYFNIAYQI
jgi:hypothetical protein